MKNSIVKSIIVLGSICLIVALLLSSVNLFTESKIKSAEETAANEAFLEVLPNADFEKVEGDFPESVMEVRRDKNGGGYAFKLTATSSYSNSPLQFIVAIGTDGKIVKISFVNYAETKGSAKDFENLLQGADSSSADILSGVTYSSNAIKTAINDAYTVLADIDENAEKPIDFTALYSKIMPDGSNFSSVALPENADPIFTAAYTPQNSIGYIVAADSGEKSFLIAINSFGKAYAVCDFEGNDLTKAGKFSDIKEKAESLFAPIYKEQRQKDRIAVLVKAEFGEDCAFNIQSLYIDVESSALTGTYRVGIQNNYIHYGFAMSFGGEKGKVDCFGLTDEDGNVKELTFTSLTDGKTQEEFKNLYGDAVNKLLNDNLKLAKEVTDNE